MRRSQRALPSPLQDGLTFEDSGRLLFCSGRAMTGLRSRAALAKQYCALHVSTQHTAVIDACSDRQRVVTVESALLADAHAQRPQRTSKPYNVDLA